VFPVPEKTVWDVVFIVLSRLAAVKHQERLCNTVFLEQKNIIHNGSVRSSTAGSSLLFISNFTSKAARAVRHDPDGKHG
jgi:hypothetical protein